MNRHAGETTAKILLGAFIELVFTLWLIGRSEKKRELRIKRRRVQLEEPTSQNKYKAPLSVLNVSFINMENVEILDFLGFFRRKTWQTTPKKKLILGFKSEKIMYYIGLFLDMLRREFQHSVTRTRLVENGAVIQYHFQHCWLHDTVKKT